MSQLMAFVLCCLGSKAILDVWFLGSIFSWYRAWAELIRDEGEWWLSRKFGELLSCRFCFSYHSSLWLSLFCLPVLPWWSIVPWWLAVRTTTAFIDSFEDFLNVKKGQTDDGKEIAVGSDDGAPDNGSSGSFFD